MSYVNTTLENDEFPSKSKINDKHADMENKSYSCHSFNNMLVIIV